MSWGHQSEEKPVYFLGKDTGLTAKSKSGAGLAVFFWLRRGNGPSIPPEYRPVYDRYKGVPTMGRLKRHTHDYPNRYEVGLGLPDRRQARVRCRPDEESDSAGHPRRP